ncbi:hypothetical protein R1flu_015071 [Riccia fluitans]|uniref:Ubiquitin-like protease family profile domain-containing protein n=1 Tax=Riccia fluitans TaxID=41844 RepID=A0ABD1YIR1_9MARC
MIKITRLRKSICPELHDEDMQGNLPVWIFVPIHGKNHWSLAIIRLHNDDAWLAHLDSSQGTHDPEAIFHVLKQVLYLIVPIDPALVMTGIMNVEQQQDGHSCGKHVLQMLAGAARKESDGLDRCFREKGLRYIATLDQGRRAGDQEKGARGKAGALRRLAEALRMAARRAASALRAGAAALIMAALRAAIRRAILGFANGSRRG